MCIIYRSIAYCPLCDYKEKRPRSTRWFFSACDTAMNASLGEHELYVCQKILHQLIARRPERLFKTPMDYTERREPRQEPTNGIKKGCTREGLWSEVHIFASVGCALTQASVSGMNDQAIASLWRTLYLCSMAETEASRWIKANMQGRTRNVFCKLRGLEETTMRIETGRLPEELVDALANDDFKLKTPQGNTALLCRHESLNRLECVLRIMCLD